MKVSVMKVIAERLEKHGVTDVHVHRHRGGNKPEDTQYSAYGDAVTGLTNEKMSVRIEVLHSGQIQEALTVTKTVENKLYQG